jgi:hypothetical protein
MASLFCNPLKKAEHYGFILCFFSVKKAKNKNKGFRDEHVATKKMFNLNKQKL